MRFGTSILLAIVFLIGSVLLSYLLSSWLPIPIIFLFLPLLFMKTWRR